MFFELHDEVGDVVEAAEKGDVQNAFVGIGQQLTGLFRPDLVDRALRLRPARGLISHNEMQLSSLSELAMGQPAGVEGTPLPCCFILHKIASPSLHSIFVSQLYQKKPALSIANEKCIFAKMPYP